MNFFFQAEDGIRDHCVTGVQTCALPIVQTAGGPVLYTAAVIESGDREIGVVLIGTSLETLVAEMKAESLADVTIYADPQTPSATTFVQPRDAGSKEADLSPPPEAISAF